MNMLLCSVPLPRVTQAAAVTAAVVCVLAPYMASETAFEPAWAELFAADEFGITIPDGWSIQDERWEKERVITFAPSGMSQDSITVSLHDEYRLASVYKHEAIEITEMDFETLEIIADDAEQRCRNNLDGPCWNHRLLDSKITAISHQKAAVIDFDAVMADRATTVRLIVLPTDSGIWVVRGVAADEGSVVDVVDATSTFYIATDKADSSAVSLTPEQWAPPDPSLVLERTLNINMIMIGQKWSSLDIARILEELPAYHDPVFTTTGDKVGVRYHYSYNFVSDVKSTKDLVHVMDENSRDRPIFGSDIFEFMFWQAEWLSHHEEIQDMQYRLVDGAAVEEYVRETIIGVDPDLTRPFSTNLVFLNIPPFEMGHLQNYYTTTTDRASGQTVDHVGMMGFGNTDNVFFFDMWAVPWVTSDVDWLFFNTYVENLHDCWEASCVADMVVHRTESSIYNILTPSFLYPVEFHEGYFLDVLLYVKPGGPVTVTPAVLDRFVSKEDILAELEYLYPFAKWDMSISLERKDLRGLSVDFKRQIAAVNNTQETYGDRVVKYQHLDSDKLKPHMIEWAQDRTAGRQVSGLNNDTSWSIPVLVVIDNTDAELVVDENALGIAAGMPGDEEQPCCALMVADASDLWEEEIGLDNLLLHEVGHLLGLHHSFASFKYGEPTYDFYFNWYSSPMTYSFPSQAYACGLLYYWFYGYPCGNAAMSFTEFERERLSDVRLASLIKKIENASDHMPASDAAEVKNRLGEIRQVFATGDTLTETGALSSALDVYGVVSGLADKKAASPLQDDKKDAIAIPHADITDSAQSDHTIDAMPDTDTSTVDKDNPNDYSAQPENDTADSTDAEAPDTSNAEFEDAGQDDNAADGKESAMMQDLSQETTTIPLWVKSSAGWWSQGLIDDAEFVSSIEYLISHEIIQVDETGITSDFGGDDARPLPTIKQQPVIPLWVKSSAGWWSQGLLSDDEFVSSIEYLISSQIIRVA